MQRAPAPQRVRYPTLRTPEQIHPWFDSFVDTPSIPLRRSRIVAEGIQTDTFYRSVTESNGHQLLVVRVEPVNAPAFLHGVYIAKTAERENPNFYLYGQSPDSVRLAIRFNGTTALFAEDPNAQGCGQCRPATNADVDKLREFLQAIHTP